VDLLEALNKIVSSLEEEGDLRSSLSSALKAAAEAIGIDMAVLYWMSPKENIFKPFHSSFGERFVVSSDGFAVGEGIVGDCAAQRKMIEIQGESLVEAHGFAGYAASIFVPCRGGRGVLALLHGLPKELSDGEKSFLKIAAHCMGERLEREELQESLSLRTKEIEAASEISRAVGSTSELESLMDLTLEIALKVMGARAGILRILDEETQVYKITSMTGGRTILHKEEFRSGTESACPVVRTGKPHRMTSGNGTTVCFSQDLAGEVSTCACVPVTVGGKILGVLSLYDRSSRPSGPAEPFSESDVSLLETMAGLIGGAISRAIHHSKIETLLSHQESILKELSVLYSSSSAMMKAIELEKLLRVILIALTLGDGLGFNRAMLFLVNEAEGVLEGKIGVGPSSPDEAGKIWAELSRSDWSLGQWLDWALSHDWSGHDAGLIHKVASSVRVPLDDQECVLVRALRARGAFTLDPRQNLKGMELLRPLEIGSECALAPIVARGEALGVILVDNLYSGKPIRERELRFLGTFASLAGLAIQNAIFLEDLRKAHRELQAMQQRLVHSEKLAAIGEFAATMAHEIRNPLVAIGGYARLLQKKHKDQYSRIICEEVERLESILRRVLDFSRDASGERTNADIRELMEECYRTLRPQIDEQRMKVRKEWTGGLPEVVCDRDQMKQVFLNLMHNALEAMGGRGTLSLRTYLSSEEDGLWIVGEVSDTGGGIPPDVLPNVFNPFFTTKEKGTGLGLAITRRIVEIHGGKIEIDNRPGIGTTFRVKLPPSAQ
jgi:signal transduction histidine kinase/putative methionine-R-sulfoxide reductase with GAF domain